MKEFWGNTLINVGFGTIGLVFFIILVIAVYCLRLAEKKAGNTPKKGFRNVIYVSVFLWGIYTFVIFIITNPLTDATWSMLKRYAVLLSLLVVVIKRTRNEKPEKTKSWKEVFKRAIERLSSLPSNICLFIKREWFLFVQGLSLFFKLQWITLSRKVVDLTQRRISNIIYFTSGLNAILLSIAILSPDKLIFQTHLTAGLLADIVNDILGVIAVIIAGIDASVPSEKPNKTD